MNELNAHLSLFSSLASLIGETEMDILNRESVVVAKQLPHQNTITPVSCPFCILYTH